MEMTMSAGNKRRAPRFEINKMVSLEADHKFFYWTGAVNLSEIGLLCHTKAGVMIGDKIFLSFSFEQDGPSREIRATGKVVRIVRLGTTAEVAIKFLKMESSDRIVLKAFLSTLKEPDHPH